MDVSTTQQRIAALAKQQPTVRFTSLHHSLDVDWLREAYGRLRKDSVPGYDRQTGADYGQDLEANRQSLLERAKSGTYVAPPVRRVHIPKGTGQATRPIGIPTTEDKLLQRAGSMLLEPIYAQDFLDCSYGFRPGRSAHGALCALWKQSMASEVQWILDVDISQFFDTWDHAHLRALLQHRVRDGVMTRLSGKWLQVGVLEQGVLRYPEVGTPQGGSASPLLSHIYGRLFGRKGTVASMLPWMDGNPRPHSGMRRSQAHGAWSASRGQRDLGVGRQPARGRRVGENQQGKPVSGEDET